MPMTSTMGSSFARCPLRDFKSCEAAIGAGELGLDLAVDGLQVGVETNHPVHGLETVEPAYGLPGCRLEAAENPNANAREQRHAKSRGIRSDAEQRAVQYLRGDLAPERATGAPADDAELVWHGCDGKRVEAIAHGKGDAFHHRSREVPPVVTGAQTREAGAEICVPVRHALAHEVGMIDEPIAADRRRPSLGVDLLVVAGS